MTQRVADAEHQIERRGIEVVGQFIPAGAKGSQRDTYFVSEFLGPANYPTAGVCRDHVQAETGETNHSRSLRLHQISHLARPPATNPAAHDQLQSARCPSAFRVPSECPVDDIVGSEPMPGHAQRQS